MNQAADRRVLLSTLWVFVVLNYVFADILVLVFDPEFYQAAAARTTPGAAVVYALLIVIVIAMVLLSRVLPQRPNRWANILAGVLGTVWVALTLPASPPSHYVVFATVEIAATLFIIGYAWTWRSVEGGS